MGRIVGHNASCCQQPYGVSGNELSLRLLSGSMADDQVYARRLGFWLRMARERAGKSQAGAAEFLGFSAKSKSTISDYENAVTVPSLQVLRRLAEWYGMPLSVFTDPEPTPEERLDAVANAAAALEREDWEAGEGQAPGAAGGQPGEPRRQSA